MLTEVTAPRFAKGKYLFFFDSFHYQLPLPFEFVSNYVAVRLTAALLRYQQVYSSFSGPLAHRVTTNINLNLYYRHSKRYLNTFILNEKAGE